jgi:hypothetical protein
VAVHNLSNVRNSDVWKNLKAKEVNCSHGKMTFEVVEPVRITVCNRGASSMSVGVLPVRKPLLQLLFWPLFHPSLQTLPRPSICLSICLSFCPGLHLFICPLRKCLELPSARTSTCYVIRPGIIIDTYGHVLLGSHPLFKITGVRSLFKLRHQL